MKKLILNVVYVALLFLLLIDNANSQTWYQQNSNTTMKLNSISPKINRTAWACGDSGTVIKTSNGGDNWINYTGNGIPTSLNLTNIFIHKSYEPPPNWLNAYATGSDSAGSYIYMTTNDGINWNKVHTVTGPGARINGIWFRDTATGFAVGEPISGRWSMWKTTNHGLTWDSAGLYLNGQNYSGFPNNLCGRVNILNDYLYIGANYNGSETRILRSTDFGTTWTILNPGISKKITSIFFVKPEYGLIGGDNYVYCTTNSGNNWNISANLSYTPNLVAVCTNTYTIANFYLKTDSAGSQSIYWGFGSYWYENMIGISGIRHIQGIDYEIYAVGDSGKIYYRQILYGQVKKIGNEIPETFRLHQNYPNPFNPVTNIRFDIPHSANVKLIIYDALGREVVTLVNEKLSAGSYETSWPAPMGDGSSYPSGVYFFRLQTDIYNKTKKMLMIK